MRHHVEAVGIPSPPPAVRHAIFSSTLGDVPQGLVSYQTSEVQSAVGSVVHPLSGMLAQVEKIT